MALKSLISLLNKILKGFGYGLWMKSLLALIESVVMRMSWVNYLYATRWWKSSLLWIIIIWLILPVVIRSSQRLSHACVSINILLWNCEWLIISVIVYLMKSTTWITVVILELIHDQFLDFEEVYLLEWKPIDFVCLWVIITCHIACFCSDVSFKFLPYQLSMVVYWTTMAVTGNEEFGFDFGEGAWEMATTSKEGSRRVNYPILT